MADFTPIVNDILREQRRVKGKAGGLHLHQELGNNLYPLLLNLVNAVQGAMQEIEEGVATLLAGSESMLQPKLAEQILALVQLGSIICEQAEPHLESAGADEVRKLIEAYRSAAAGLEELVRSATVEYDEDEDDEDDEDEDDDDEDDDSEDEVEDEVTSE